MIDCDSCKNDLKRLGKIIKRIKTQKDWRGIILWIDDKDSHGLTHMPPLEQIAIMKLTMDSMYDNAKQMKLRFVPRKPKPDKEDTKYIG